ncbi:MAG: FtsW/RodA/SpoVE family cell cycle protein [Planctomycetaceae bacterium]
MLEWIRTLPICIPLSCMLISIAGLCGLYRADQLYGASRQFERQLVWIGMAWPVMLLVTTVSYRRLKHLSPAFYAICVVLLVVVLFMPAINGSRRWIPLGLFDFQPSEPARLAFILALSYYLMYRDSQRTVAGLIVPFLMTMVPLLLVLREPDLGTSMLFLPILFALLFAAGARTSHLLAALTLGIAMLPVVWLQMSDEQKSRVVMVFQQQDGGLAPAGDGFHLHQSKQVLALGGLWGSIADDEPVIDDPAAYVLPASRTDFILCLIGERYGLTGCVLLLFLYGIIVWKGLTIANRTREPFGRLVAVGVVTMLGTQALINAGMIVGLVPITGLTLPMCSYGGSSLLSTYFAMGLLMNIGMRPGYEVTSGQTWETR